jgi:hypothetical protein
MNEQHADVTALHLSTVDVKPSTVDWSGESERGDYSEPYPFWEAFDYEDDGQTWQLIASGGSVVAVVIDGTPYSDYGTYADDWRDEHGGDTDDAGEPDALTEEAFDALLEVEPYMWGAEGPMMNYYYPLEESDGEWRSFDAVAAALAVADLPVCVVEMDGDYGLALTGGGMDLSWEICAAYVALPAMASEWGDREETVYLAMLRSLDVAAGWMTRGAERLNDQRARRIGSAGERPR